MGVPFVILISTVTLQSNVFADITTTHGLMRTHLFYPTGEGKFPGIVLYSEIFQLTGPIRRTAAFLAGHGYVVAVPEVYHELEAPGTVLPYDQAGADKGNFNKYEKHLDSYDEDARAVLDYLRGMKNCNGRLGVMGICLGGHLAFRAAMQNDVLATACFYATDLHSATLGKEKNDDSLQRASEIKGELLMIWGRQDPHVPLEGRVKIKAQLEQSGVMFSWLEVNAAHAFLRDEGPRYDPALAQQCLQLTLDLFQRNLGH
jgi:carboxymethylenebutenolidase